MRVGTLRLRSVKFKGGAELRVLRNEGIEEDKRLVRHRVEQVLSFYGEGDRIAGYAFMVWGPDSSSTVSQSANDLSKVPSIMIGDFVKERLRADTVQRWTLENLAELED